MLLMSLARQMPAGLRIARALSNGQAALELALLTPILALLLIIVGDSARVYYTAIELTGAAQAGAVYGGQSPIMAGDLAGIEQAARADAADLRTMTIAASTYCECPGDDAQFACSGMTACLDRRAYVEVDTAATFHTLINYPGISSSLALKGKAVRRVE
jgi:Flp pilus assembly protein TadG